MSAPSIDDLVGAQGKFAVFTASMLQRAGVATMMEFADLLRCFAETVVETEPGEAALLVAWADAIGAPMVS